MDTTTTSVSGKRTAFSPGQPSTLDRRSSKQVYDIDDVPQARITLMTLRKPTELKKVIDSVPKPVRAVPKNGLPQWYKLGLENKLPVPKMPAGKILFSRGKIGEDVRRVGLGTEGPRHSFDLTDPNCFNVSFDYVAVHDPHLAYYFRQKPARDRMKELGLCTSDNRAVCTLREFNLYRKSLYNRYMDRINMVMKKLDEQARDILVLKRVEADVKRRAVMFGREEKAREYAEKYERILSDEIAEKKRLVKEQEMKVILRMKYLAEYNEKQRSERKARVNERENRIKQRVQAAAEMELRRKITMVRQWRTNEKRRLGRLAAERAAKERKLEEQANLKWQKRMEAQNRKIRVENELLRLYTEDMAAGAARRAKKSELDAYNHDLEVQAIRLSNWKALHGSHARKTALVRKMGFEFEKSKRGAKGMSPELALEMAQEAMGNAGSTPGDALMILGQARARMDLETVLPSAPIRILEQILETAIVEFARRRVHNLLRHVERVVHARTLSIYLTHANQKTSNTFRRSKERKFAAEVTAALTKHLSRMDGQCIAFGEVDNIPQDDNEEEMANLKSCRDRPPTPVPSMTKLAEVTFTDRVDDLPDPVTVATFLPERDKLLEMIKTAARIISRNTNQKVEKGLDVIIASVTLPHLRHKMEWGEAVESLSEAVVNNRVHPDCPDIRHCCEFLTYRILLTLRHEMILDKQQRKSAASVKTVTSEEEGPQQDFYVPTEESATKTK